MRKVITVAILVLTAVVLFLVASLLGWVLLMLLVGNILWQDWEVAPNAFKVICMIFSFLLSGIVTWRLVRIVKVGMTR